MKNRIVAAIGIAAIIIAILAPLTVTSTYAAVSDDADQYVINLNVVGENCSVVTNSTQDVYNYGDIVELTAVAGTGWTFTGWSGDINDTANPLVVTVESNVTLSATFTQDNYTLTINVVGQGSVTPENQTYLSGTSVDVQATAADNWTFSGWSGDLTDTSASSTIVMDTNKTLTATFTEITTTTDEPTPEPTQTPIATPEPTAIPTVTPTVHPTTNPTATPAPTQSPAATVTSTPKPSVAQSGVSEILVLAVACIIIVIVVGAYIAKRKK